MTRTAIQKVKDKDKLFKIWRSSREGADHKKYTRARNQAKWECQRAERDFEMKIAKESLEGKFESLLQTQDQDKR